MSGTPTVAFKKLGVSTLLGTGLTNIFTADSSPPNAIVQVLSIWIANIDSVAHTVTLRSGGTTTTDSLLEAVAIAANTSYFIDTSGGSGCVVMAAGESMQGLADVANKITVKLYGAVIT